MSKWRLAGWDRGREREEREKKGLSGKSGVAVELWRPQTHRGGWSSLCVSPAKALSEGCLFAVLGLARAGIGTNRIGSSASSDAIIVLRLRGLRQEFCRCYFVLDLPFDLPCYLSYHYYHYDYQYCLLLPD